MVSSLSLRTALDWDAEREKVSQLRSISSFEQQANPLRLDAMRMQNEASGAALRSNREKAAIGTMDFGRELIARAAADIDPADPKAAEKWDAAMRKAAEAGATDAEQYVGRYNPQLQTRVTSVYSAASPLAALQSQTMDQPLTAAGAAPQASPADMQARFSETPPEQMAQVLQNFEEVRGALQRVNQSQNPAQTWDEEAVKMGQPELVGQYSPMRAAQMWNDIEGPYNFIRQTVAQQGLGVPNAPPAGEELENIGGIGYGVSQGPQGLNLRQLTQPAPEATRWTVVGTTPDGQAVYMDPATGEERTGSTQMASTRGAGGGSGGRPSVFEQKMAAAKAAGYSDTDALDIATGRKSMSPAQAREQAAAQAARDLQAASLADPGGIADPTAYLKEREAYHYANLTSAASAGPDRPTVPGGPAQAQQTQQRQDRGQNPWTEAQRRAQRYYKGAEGAFGTQHNPRAPRWGAGGQGDADYARLPNGTWYINPEGDLARKGYVMGPNGQLVPR